MANRIVELIQFFDIDGVLTDTTEQKVNLEAVGMLARDLERGVPVVLETGRGWGWVKEQILDRLTERISDRKFLEHLFVSVEKGGIYFIYRLGKWEETIKAGVLLDKKFVVTVDKLTDKYRKTMDRTESRKTMCSVVMHKIAENTSQEVKDKKLREFQKQRDVLVEEFKHLLDSSGLSDIYEVDPTTIAVDIQPKGVGKRLGTREAIEWLEEKGIKAKIYEVFGDSLSDVDMVFELAEHGFGVKLIYVGEGSKLEGMELPFERDVRDKMYDKGTVGYLREQSR